jgi:hypothetical protein
MPVRESDDSNVDDGGESDDNNDERDKDWYQSFGRVSLLLLMLSLLLSLLLLSLLDNDDRSNEFNVSLLKDSDFVEAIPMLVVLLAVEVVVAAAAAEVDSSMFVSFSLFSLAKRQPTLRWLQRCPQNIRLVAGNGFGSDW